MGACPLGWEYIFALCVLNLAPPELSWFIVFWGGEVLGKLTEAGTSPGHVSANEMRTAVCSLCKGSSVDVVLCRAMLNAIVETLRHV